MHDAHQAKIPQARLPEIASEVELCATIRCRHCRRSSGEGLGRMNHSLTPMALLWRPCKAAAVTRLLPPITVATHTAKPVTFSIPAHLDSGTGWGFGYAWTGLQILRENVSKGAWCLRARRAGLTTLSGVSPIIVGTAMYAESMPCCGGWRVLFPQWSDSKLAAAC